MCIYVCCRGYRGHPLFKAKLDEDVWGPWHDTWSKRKVYERLAREAEEEIEMSKAAILAMGGIDASDF